MKSKIVQCVLLSSLLSFAVACSDKKEESASAPVIDKEQIKKEIQEKENEFAATYNSGVVKNIGYYADDAISYSQNKAPLVGREAIVSYYQSGIDSSVRGNKISFTTNEVFVSNDGNQVVEVGNYKLVDSANADLNSGNYMILFEKRDGKYVSVREMSASDLPLN